MKPPAEQFGNDPVRSSAQAGFDRQAVATAMAMEDRARQTSDPERRLATMCVAIAAYQSAARNGGAMGWLAKARLEALGTQP